MFKTKDEVKVLVGVYKDEEGVVEAIAPDAPLNIGVIIIGSGLVSPVWFNENEIEKC